MLKLTGTIEMFLASTSLTGVSVGFYIGLLLVSLILVAAILDLILGSIPKTYAFASPQISICRFIIILIIGGVSCIACIIEVTTGVPVYMYIAANSDIITRVLESILRDS